MQESIEEGSQDDHLRLTFGTPSNSSLKMRGFELPFDPAILSCEDSMEEDRFDDRIERVDGERSTRAKKSYEKADHLVIYDHLAD